MQKNIKIKFWGIRGSLPVGSSKFASNTSCVELKVREGVSFFMDAGTGIRAATQNRRFEKMWLFLSHFHWDHIQGLPFIHGLGENDFRMKVLSGYSDMWDRLGILFDQRFYPVELKTLARNLDCQVMESGASLEFEELKLSMALLNHPGRSYALRVEGEMGSFVYATDSDYDPVPPEAEKLLKNADWVVLDSQFLIGDALKKANYGHASFKAAIDTAARLRVKNAILFHFDPSYNDEDLERLAHQSADYAASTFGANAPIIHLAREGMELDLKL
jgi:phosphoribosyl 1,2-cyclic phosphodiesterase